MSESVTPQARAGFDAATSTLRTYRYLRLSIVASVLFLGAALGWYLATVGPLESISASYYTPVRTVLSGTLLAVSLGLVGLSGKGLRRFLLLLAAITAPFIAVVPTPISGESLRVLTGTGCLGGAAMCVGVSANEIDGPLVALLFVDLIATVTALVLIRRPWRGRQDGIWSTPLARGTVGVLAGLVLISTWTIVAPSSFRATAHFGSAGLFFILIAIVVILRAWDVKNADWTGKRVAATVFVRVYRVLGIALFVDVALLATLVGIDGRLLDVDDLIGRAWVFVLESVALTCFAAYWFIQTLETWNTVDPSLTPPEEVFDSEQA